MTKKDYIKFANMVVDLTRNNQESFTRNNLINRLIDIFSNDNYRFNENKFVEFIEKNEKFYEITYDR
tara:strand:+ start:547 stop:747 length:201 start_codon:yes stop_codon:yes gene_type:complete